MATQTTYTERMAPVGPGTISGSDFETTTALCETASPGIPFGRAVSQGTLSDKGIVIGGSLVGFRGVSVKDKTLIPDNADAYLPPNNVGVLHRGSIWAEPNTAVAANDPVWFNSTNGLLGNATGTNMVGPVKGARWITSCGVGGRAIAYVPGYDRNT